MEDDNLYWDELLLYLEQGLVIPILGKDLLTLEIEGKPVNAYRLLADRLADELRISRNSLPEGFTLNQVVAAYPRFREKRGLIYSQIKAIFDRMPPGMPESLRLLAQIPAFHLYVTTTFDSWLETLLAQERAGGRARPLSISYSPEHAPDIAPEQLSPENPTVFHLFGRVCATPHYAVTEEDLLEYLHHLQARPPKNLCDALREHHLLFLGNDFSDWLARFFVRTVRGERLTAALGKEVFIVDNELRRSATLTSFFHGFCWETNVLTENTPIEFVRTLHQKWFERHPLDATPAPPARDMAASAPQPGASHCIFLSYASEDFEAVSLLRAQLEQAGLNAWMDKRGGLSEGDMYRAKIKRDILRCTLFMPVISKNADSRGEGYFREEWDEALKRLPRFKGSSRPFLIPVVIDDTDLYRAMNIPQEFKEIHVTNAPAGMPSAESCSSLQHIIRGIIKTEGGGA